MKVGDLVKCYLVSAPLTFDVGVVLERPAVAPARVVVGSPAELELKAGGRHGVETVPGCVSVLWSSGETSTVYEDEIEVIA